MTDRGRGMRPATRLWPTPRWCRRSGTSTRTPSVSCGMGGAGRAAGTAAHRLPGPPRGAPGRGVARRGPAAHLTASCLVLDESGERVLLTLHKRAREWFQLGGHLEGGDTSLWDAARREAREESGIGTLEPLRGPVQLDRHLLVGSFGAAGTPRRAVRRGRPRRRRSPGRRGVARRAVVAGRRPARGHARRADAPRVSRPPPCSPAERLGSGRWSPRRPLAHSRRGPGRWSPVDGVVVGTRNQPLGVGQPVEEPARPLQPGVGGEQPPERRGRAGHE